MEQNHPLLAILVVIVHRTETHQACARCVLAYCTVLL